MNDREFFCQRHQAEFPTFNRVLDALPLTQFTYRPHDRSPSTLDLVWTLATIMACQTPHFFDACRPSWRGSLILSIQPALSFQRF